MTRLSDQLDPEIAPRLERSALVVVDVQVDFLDGGASPIPGTTEVLPRIRALQEAYRSAGRPIVHIVRLYDGDDVDRVRRMAIASGASIVRPGTPGAELPAALRVGAGAALDAELLLSGGVQQLAEREVAIWKPRWSAFHRTPLHEHLTAAGVDTVVFAGCNFPNCPRASMTDASAFDYRVLIAADAISGVLPQHLEEAGRIGVVHADSDEIARALAGDGQRG